MQGGNANELGSKRLIKTEPLNHLVVETLKRQNTGRKILHLKNSYFRFTMSWILLLPTQAHQGWIKKRGFSLAPPAPHPWLCRSQSSGFPELSAPQRLEALLVPLFPLSQDPALHSSPGLRDWGEWCFLLLRMPAFSHRFPQLFKQPPHQILLISARPWWYSEGKMKQGRGGEESES